MEQEPLPLWSINQLILNNKKRYIYGTDLESARVFFLLLSERIEIEGFIDEKLQNGKIWNKNIYDFKILDGNEETVLVVPDKEIVHKDNLNICRNIMTLNPQLPDTNIYIYGAGNVGKFVLEKLHFFGIKVKGFIDSDIEKRGKRIVGYEVFGKEILCHLTSGDVIIEAGKYHSEIDEDICAIQDKVKRFYCAQETDCAPRLMDCVVVDKKKMVCMRSYTLLQLAEGTFHKKIMLWGDDYELAYNYWELLELMGFSYLYIISEQYEDTGKKYKRISDIEDVMYESDYTILLYGSQITGYIYKMKRLGLKQGQDYVLLDYPVKICKMGDRQQIFDVNLGYTYKMNWKYPGFQVLGSDNKNDFKIAILGGSTSDGDLYWFRSWPEIFYEKYCTENISIYNGALAGYNSAQELIKLMRDVVYLKPDMLIVLDGINDIASCGRNGRNMFGFSYLSTIMNQLIKSKSLNYYALPMELDGAAKIWNGMENRDTEIIEEWRKNVQYMKAVAEINLFQFHAFLQPMLLGKEDPVSLHEASLMKMDKISMGCWFEDQCKIFRQYGEKMENQWEFFHDLSKIFDDKDVYMDECHVYESGNIIIADEIYNRVRKGMPL